MGHEEARRNFASDKSWIESVTECEPAFDLIIASIDSHEENVVSIENLEPKKPPFFQDRSVTTPCLSDGMINSMRLLIEESHEFVIVDPYCRPEFNSSKVSKMAKMMAYGSGTILMAKSGMRGLGKMV